MSLMEITAIAIAIGGLLDAIHGYLPDKWIPYIGATRRIVRKILGIDPPQLKK